MRDDEFRPLEENLNHFAVIRTSLETLTFFPRGYENIAREIRDVAERARQELSDGIGKIVESVGADPAAFAADFEGMKRILLDLAVRGWSGRCLDSMMRVSAFGEHSYRFELPGDLDAAEASTLRGNDFFLRVLRDLHLRVNDRANCIDKETFDRAVFQPFIAILFAFYATTDPLNYLDRAE